MKAVRYFLLITMTVLFAFSDSLSQTEPVKADQKVVLSKNDSKNENEDNYRIGFQDTLEIQVFKHPELSQKVKVNPDGTISLYRAVKPISAVCRTERELAAVITQEYLSFLKKPEVNVVAIEQRSQSLGVIGAVEKPGSFYINRKVRLLELLAFAGGPNKEAGSRMIVARTGSTSACRTVDEQQTAENTALELMSFKIRDIQEGRQDLWMKPGDIVSVLDTDVIYVYGNVNKQGEVKIREPKTLRQVIASAEGFAPSAKKDKIRVLRQKSGSNDWEEFVYSLKEIDSGKVQDPILSPNDIVAVSEDKVSKIFNDLKTSLTGGIGGAFYRIP